MKYDKLYNSFKKIVGAFKIDRDLKMSDRSPLRSVVAIYLYWYNVKVGYVFLDFWLKGDVCVWVAFTIQSSELCISLCTILFLWTG